MAIAATERTIRAMMNQKSASFFCLKAHIFWINNIQAPFTKNYIN
jgi:hypothetical protein